MAHHQTSTPLPAGFRRRFPLELSPDGDAALEAAGKDHGSKRAALLVGLAALKASGARDGELARAAKERDAARTKTTRLEARITELERAAGVARSTPTRAKNKADATEAALSEMTERAARAEADWQDERTARIAAEKRLNHLARERVDELRCPRCGDWASSSEWAEEPTPDGRLVYHHSCGFNRGGLLENTSVLGRRTT
jgi:hypothetical protein